MPSLWQRAYHACRSGLVEESRKYGSPTLSASSARMRNEGFAPAVIFNAGLGRIGSAATLAARTTMCPAACCRGENLSLSQCAQRYPSSSTAWKNNMHVLHTAEAPPNHGSISFAMIG